MRSTTILLLLLPLSCSDTVAHWPSMSVSQRQRLINDFTTACGLPADRLQLIDDQQLTLRPNPNDPYERVDCLLAKLNEVQGVKLGFVGNEAYVDTNQ